MRSLIRYNVAVLLLVVMQSCAANNQVGKKRADITPFDYGLENAKNGMDRYEVLQRTHQTALELGVNVDYSGVKSIELEIPKGAKPIPLTQNNDFKGCIFNVKNTWKRISLFTTIADSKTIVVSGKDIDDGNFRNYPQLRKGKSLLIIKDENPWVENRRGHDYGHLRQDVLLIVNGLAKNTVIQPYNNCDSKPMCNYIIVKKQPLEVKNVTVNRDPTSTAVATAFEIAGFEDVRLSDITVNTPESEMTGDRAIRVTNSTNVSFTDVRINGTYSQRGKYGYGISLDNVWNFQAKRLYGRGNWGIFGNNNVNTATIEDSEINRFDIHCYGRDVKFRNVKFFDLYNQFSSIFGSVIFEQCVFRNFTPVLIETSYNAYTEFQVDFKDCEFYTTPEKNYLVNTGSLSGAPNARRELTEKRLPKVNVNNLKVISLETGEEERQVDVFLKKGRFIQERKIQNVIKLK